MAVEKDFISAILFSIVSSLFNNISSPIVDVYLLFVHDVYRNQLQLRTHVLLPNRFIMKLYDVK